MGRLPNICLGVSLRCYLAGEQHLRRKMLHDALYQHIFVVTLTGVQAAKRPEVAQVQLGECPTVAKIAIGQNLWQEPVYQYVQLNYRHNRIPLMTCAGATAREVIVRNNG